MLVLVITINPNKYSYSGLVASGHTRPRNEVGLFYSSHIANTGEKRQDSLDMPHPTQSEYNWTRSR